MFNLIQRLRKSMLKEGGIVEKKEATDKKIEVASKILDRRTHEQRRQEGERRIHRMTMLESEFGRH